jgi:hypothetical protein
MVFALLIVVGGGLTVVKHMGSMWVGDLKLHCSVFVDVLICVMS